MGFREDLDLGEVLPLYREGIDGKTPTAPDYSDVKIPRSLYATPLTEKTTAFPKQVGNGPSTCSTVTALEPFPAHVWDTNGYYSALGVSSRASRKQLREGYQAVGGQSSVWITYCLSQLLDPSTRRAYDLTPLGSRFMDRYEQKALKDRAKAEARRKGVAPEQVLDDWGYALHPEDPYEEPDGQMPEPENLTDLEEMGQRDDVEVEWVFSYFLWRTGQRSIDRLAEWQTLLISALARRGKTPPLAVGYVGNQPHPYVVGKVGTTHIVFLNTGCSPTEETADSAARALLRELESV